MARVRNWQINREMSYWYPESRPQRQFAAVFDTNKCISCQTCTLACKTTWTSGKGQEYMLWNNVETKPYGFYPLAWDLKLLEKLGPQTWTADGAYEGRTIFEAAEAGERVLGWRPEDIDYSYPNVGEDDCVGTVERGADLQLPHAHWFFYLARICNHCTYPACLASCPRGSIYKRSEDGIVLVDQGRCRGENQAWGDGSFHTKRLFEIAFGVRKWSVGRASPRAVVGVSPGRLAGTLAPPEQSRRRRGPGGLGDAPSGRALPKPSGRPQPKKNATVGSPN